MNLGILEYPTPFRDEGRLLTRRLWKTFRAVAIDKSNLKFEGHSIVYLSVSKMRST